MASRSPKLQARELKPYQSVLLLKRRGNGKGVGPVALAKATSKLLGPNTSMLSPVSETEAGGLSVGFVTYQESVRASWTSNPLIVDTLQQLVVVCAKGDYIAIFTSDNGLRENIRGVVKAQEEEPWELVALVDPATLNAALLQHGIASTLWLSGIHRRVASKVDNKVVTGLDLQYALDPLNDQTFFFTAARANAQLGGQQAKVGVAPRKSAVWMGLSADWNAFCVAMRKLMDALAVCSTATQTPFPVLAEPVDGIGPSSLGTIYDAAIVPPEMLGTGLSIEEQQRAEKWSDAILEVDTVKGKSRIHVSLPGGIKVCTAEITVEPASGGGAARLRSTVTPEHNQSDNVSELQSILRHNQGWLKLWYDSGVVLADRRLFRPRFRDLPFNDWRWEKLAGFSVDQEKPSNFNGKNIGTAKSLFCWVLKEWAPPKASAAYKGEWLACNDGKMEVADFIHLDKSGVRPCVTLIHAKGATSASASRQVAVAPYEVVVGQAVKNIRHVDHEILQSQFTQSLDKRIQDAVWSNRKPCKRASMLAEFRALGADVERRLVVFQPHVRKTAWENARAGKAKPVELHAMRQLDALLLSARASCQAVGAEFVVIGHDA